MENVIVGGPIVAPSRRLKNPLIVAFLGATLVAGGVGVSAAVTGSHPSGVPTVHQLGHPNPKGNNPGSGPAKCTYIPGYYPGGHCPIN